MLNGQCYKEVHHNAMLSLIANRRDPVDSYPETLYLDVRRLKSMYKEFEHISTLATMAVVFAAETGQTTLDNLSDILCEENLKFDEAAERLINLAPPEKRERAIGILKRTASLSDPVRHLIQARIKKAFRNILHPSITPLLPRINRLIGAFNALCAVNWAVHLPTYHRLVHEAVFRYRGRV